MLTWLDLDPTSGMVVSKGEEMLAEVKDLWSVPTAWTSWGRVRFSSDTDIQHSQKGDNDSLWSEAMKYTPFIGWACVGPLLRTRASLLMPLMSLSLSKDCSPRSGKFTLYANTRTLVCSFSLLQPLHSTAAVLGFKWSNHGLTPVFCTWQHSSNYKRNTLLDH